MKKKNEISMPLLNPFAAGIDVGSKSHYVAVGQNKEDVREFGVCTLSHQRIIDYLRINQRTTIAMESTGSYWQSLFRVLQQEGFEVLLVPGNQTKNARSKTDVKDCQWIQKLHSLGLLTGCFLPDEATMKLRNLQRHRSSLVEATSAYKNKIQRVLRLMNIRLDVSIRDVTGKTGIRIIESILNGERDAKVLIQLVDSRVKKSRQEIENNLQGEWNSELLYELKDCYELFLIFQQKINNCDLALDEILKEQTKEVVIDQDIQLTKKQVKGKNQPKIDIQSYTYKIYGTDLFSINGFSVGSALTLISEVGLGIYNFDSSKKFVSWLRLAPNNRISGGKILSSRTEKSKNKVTKSLRDVANAIGLSKKDDYLCLFFRKIAYKKGRGAAITATARKVAVIIWNMINKKCQYNPIKTEEYLHQQKQRKLKYLKKDLQKYNITINELSMCYE